MPQVGQTGPYGFIAGSSVKVGAGRSAFCGTFPGSPPLGVTQRPALRSPDFPPPGTHFNRQQNYSNPDMAGQPHPGLMLSFGY